MDKNTKIKIRNRSTGTVGYTIPDMGNYHRKFMANETKEISFEEIQKLSYLPGGSYILENYLVIESPEARNEIIGGVELEYVYDAKDVKRLLLEASLDEFLDCLEFAPAGVIEMVKKMAVDLEINDIRKRRAILEKTGFNVDNAIMINEETSETKKEEVPTGRRVVPNQASAPTGRRFDVSKR